MYAFSTSADSVADEGDGAVPCASGSQMWQGNSAALKATPPVMRDIAQTT